MAKQLLASELQEEMICPICMDILQEPVTIDCGHNFCFTCISQVGQASDRFLRCPLCKSSVKTNTFRPNWLLVNLVEKIHSIHASETQPEEEELRCQRHGERLHYFCEDDREFLCVVCRDSKDHKFHRSSLIDEAAQNYQGQIQRQVQELLQKEEEIVLEKAEGEEKIDAFTTQVEFERQRILAEFRNVRQDLEKEENFLLSQLDWLAQDGAKGRKSYITSIDEQLNSLKKLIDALKAKQQMPPRQLLRDIEVTLDRSEEFQFLSPTLVLPDWEKKLSEAKSRHDSITEAMKKFRDELQDDGKKDNNTFFKSMIKNRRQRYQLEKGDPEPTFSSRSPAWPPGIFLQGKGTSKPVPLLPKPKHPLLGASFAEAATPSAVLQAPRSRASYAEGPRHRSSSDSRQRMAVDTLLDTYPWQRPVSGLGWSGTQI